VALGQADKLQDELAKYRQQPHDLRSHLDKVMCAHQPLLGAELGKLRISAMAICFHEQLAAC
jgi:hypothetical protein